MHSRRESARASVECAPRAIRELPPSAPSPSHHEYGNWQNADRETRRARSLSVCVRPRTPQKRGNAATSRVVLVSPTWTCYYGELLAISQEPAVPPYSGDPYMHTHTHTRPSYLQRSACRARVLCRRLYIQTSSGECGPPERVSTKTHKHQARWFSVRLSYPASTAAAVHFIPQRAYSHPSQSFVHSSGLILMKRDRMMANRMVPVTKHATNT